MSTKKRSFKSQSEFTLESNHMEKVEGKSLTVPDEAMSIKHILEKHSRGQNMDTFYREPAYDPSASLESIDLEKISALDLTEKQELMEHLSLQIEQQKKSVDEQQKKLQASKAEEEAKKFAENFEKFSKVTAGKKAGTKGAKTETGSNEVNDGE